MDDGGANERIAAAASKEDSRCILGGGNSLFSIELLSTFQKQVSLYFLGYLDIFGPMMIKRSIIGSFARKCILTDHRECRQTLAPPDHHLYVLFDDD